MNSSRSRKDILESVRSRYVEKFGPEASPTIDKALNKVTDKLDIDAIESELRAKFSPRSTKLSPRRNTALESYKKLPTLEKKLEKIMGNKKRSIESLTKKRYKIDPPPQLDFEPVLQQQQQHKRKAQSVLRTVEPSLDKIRVTSNFSPKKQSVWDTMINIDHQNYLQEQNEKYLRKKQQQMEYGTFWKQQQKAREIQKQKQRYQQIQEGQKIVQKDLEMYRKEVEMEINEQKRYKQIIQNNQKHNSGALLEAIKNKYESLVQEKAGESFQEHLFQKKVVEQKQKKDKCVEMSKIYEKAVQNYNYSPIKTRMEIINKITLTDNQLKNRVSLENPSDQNYVISQFEKNKLLHNSQFQHRLSKNDTMYQFAKTQKNHAVFDRERDEILKKNALDSMMATDHVRDEKPDKLKQRFNRTQIHHFNIEYQQYMNQQKLQNKQDTLLTDQVQLHNRTTRLEFEENLKKENRIQQQKELVKIWKQQHQQRLKSEQELSVKFKPKEFMMNKKLLEKSKIGNFEEMII